MKSWNQKKRIHLKRRLAAAFSIIVLAAAVPAGTIFAETLSAETSESTAAYTAAETEYPAEAPENTADYVAETSEDSACYASGQEGFSAPADASETAANVETEETADAFETAATAETEETADAFETAANAETEEAADAFETAANAETEEAADAFEITETAASSETAASPETAGAEGISWTADPEEGPESAETAGPEGVYKMSEPADPAEAPEAAEAADPQEYTEPAVDTGAEEPEDKRESFKEFEETETGLGTESEETTDIAESPKAGGATETTEIEITGENETGPVICLTDVPAMGENRPLQGCVFRGDGGSFNPADYRISIYLQLYEGGEYYKKPTNLTPYVDLFDDGSFSGKFNTGGNDINARILHVMLIPSNHTPGAFGLTKDAALDYVKITRAEGGAVTVAPSRPEPEIPGRQPAISAQLPVSKNRIALDVGFYTDGSQPGSALSESLIRRQLEAISGFTDTVRFYGAAGELAKAYKIAHSMGFSIVGTAWLSGNQSADRAEMNALIDHCNRGYVQVACVGNETLLSKSLTAPQLIEDIRYVRERLADSSIPVTTSDSVDLLIENASVRNACNLIMPNCYPFWGGTDISQAAASFIESINNLKAASGGKQVLVSETGWPTAGPTKGNAVPGETQAKQYFEAIRAWSLATGTQVLWFDAADEPWKASNEGIWGAHWGILTTDFRFKQGYAELDFFKPFAIIDIAKAQVTGIVNKTYAGRRLTQDLTVRIGTDTLVEGTDYTVSYTNNTHVGTATITIKGKGSYKGSITKTFKILKAEQSITVKTTASRIAVGQKAAVSISGAKGDKSFISSDSTIATVNGTTGLVSAKKVGIVTITAKSARTADFNAASKKITIKVVPPKTISFTAANQAKGIKLTWEKVTGATAYILSRNGEEFKMVKGGSTVTYTDTAATVNGKKYTYKIIAKADTGRSTQSASAAIYQVARPAISSAVRTASTKMTVKWGANTKATGYRIQYSTDKSFSENVTNVTIKNAADKSKVIGSLTAGRTYYVRLRTYKKVNEVNYWSAWSPVKTVQ